MTGSTFDKGNFIFKEYEKHAFLLTDRKQGRPVRTEDFRNRVEQKHTRGE
jgi:formylmethanofuran dehydrogenase subunit E